MKNINIEAEGSELVLSNKNGDHVIIPKKDREKVQQYLASNKHYKIDQLVATLPTMEKYAEDGTIIPDPPTSRTIYQARPTEIQNNGVDIVAEAPQWLKDKRKNEKTYSKQQFASEYLPKFAGALGETADNLSINSQAKYDKRINDKVVENIFKQKPTFDDDYSNDRLKTLQGFSQKELELIKNSDYAHKIEPSIWSKFEQGLLSIGNAGSPVRLKNPSLSQEEARKENNPLNILQPLTVPSKIVQSTYKKDYSLKDAFKGKANNAGIGEDLITDPLNLVGLGIWGKLSKANKFAKIEDAYQAVKGLSKEEGLSKLNQLVETLEINAGRFDHDLSNNKNLAWKDDEIESGIKGTRPYNTKTNKFLQEEYIENKKTWYESPEFNRIMKEEYPDVNKEKYIEKTLENLQKQITYNTKKQLPNTAGVYYGKTSNDAVFVSKPNFRQRVNVANQRKLIPEGEGQSYLMNMSATDHELSHQRTNSGELLPDYLTRDYLWKNINKDISSKPMSEVTGEFGHYTYFSKPTEFEVRISQLREDLKRESIVDYFNTPIQENHVQELIDKYKTLTTEYSSIMKEQHKLQIYNKELKKYEMPPENREKYFELENKLMELEDANKTSNANISKDTEDLLQRWNANFLAENARKLGVIIPPAIIGTQAIKNNKDK